MQGVRIPLDLEGKPRRWPSVPGEYFGPTRAFTGGVPAVFFLKPNARDEGTPAIGRSVQHVVSPPHVFTEEADGSLTITPSIGNMHHIDTDGATRDVDDGWHGYLTRGEWVPV